MKQTHLDCIKSTYIQSKGGIDYYMEEYQFGGPKSNVVIMDTCYSGKDGSYVGDWGRGDYLHERGITPEAATKGSSCIGKSIDGKWYGWSQRGIAGFEVGYVVEKEDTILTEEGVPVYFIAVDEEDCKYLAMKFAESVS